MKIATLEDGRTEITMHQSWLNTFANCPELARRTAFDGLDDPGSDATAIGTGLHSGAEHHLLTGAAFDACYDMAVESFRHEVSLDGFQWVQVKNESTALTYLRVCLMTWFSDILPQLGTPVAVEHRFKVPLYEDDKHVVMLGGTIDYVDDLGLIWDWKTAMDADKYGKRKQWEYKRWSIQPTPYTYAWHHETGEYAPFIFAVTLKGAQQKPAQFVTVERNETHWAWMERQVRGIVTLWEAGLSEWPLRDTHVLCSPRWCPAWTTCKGKYVTM